MKLKLGIIGALDTVDKIKNIAMAYEEQIEIMEYPYENKNETIEILKKAQDQVDVLLFSGQIPYSIAKQEGAITKPAVYIPRTGTSVYRAFWQMRNDGIDYTKISFDTIEEKAIHEVINELDIPIKKLYMKPYSGDIDYDELVAFHYSLWKDKKINIATTCISRVYKKLQELNVPVFKLYPTASLIREYVNKAIYKGDVEKIKGTQIAVQIVKIKNKNANMSSQYEFLKLKNKLEEELIPYTQDNFGSIFPFGRDEYLIFTTRGAISAQLENFSVNHYLQGINELQAELATGIGFGKTVYEAEANARIAMGYAIDEKNNSIFIVDEDGNISGPLRENDGFSLSYELAVTSKEIQEIAEQIKISAAYISKIKAIIEKVGTNQINAEELANYLGISVRSGRRILKQITDAGYGTVIATESVASAGRPRQIYEISF